MKKIPTLFKRTFDDRHRIVAITDELTDPAFKCCLNGGAVPTVKIDGACCAIIGGELYKRYDAKKGKNPPAGAIPCQDAPDAITGHWPHWAKCDESNPEDKWFFAAFEDYINFDKYKAEQLKSGELDGTYEAIGKHFNGNPYGFETCDTLEKHGNILISCEFASFEEIKQYLRDTRIEGIVFWKDGEPLCKIKRSDFGFEWPVKRPLS